jgi:hypothetical protein
MALKRYVVGAQRLQKWLKWLKMAFPKNNLVVAQQDNGFVLHILNVIFFAVDLYIHPHLLLTALTGCLLSGYKRLGVVC